MTEESRPLHVVELRSENIKRLKAVTIRPDGAVVVIGGRNAQGKSSLLDSIEFALAGGRSIPVEPVRHGARRGRIVADLGEIVVERTFTSKGSTLEVRGADGVPKASPQKLLDQLCSKVAFDPLEFARMEPKKQDETLKRVLGLDLSDIEAARTKLYEQRTAANREVKRLEALLESKPEHRDAPKELVDVAEAAAQLKAAGDRNAARQRAADGIARRRERIAEKKAMLADLERQLEELELQVIAARKGIEEDTADTMAAERDLPPEESVLELEETIRTAEAKNAKVRANTERKRIDADLRKHEKAAEELSDTIESLDREKAERLAAAKFPIAGLGFDDIGPTLNGVPLAQASQAEALRLSVAIGAALNPRVKVMLIREGSRLDDEGLELLAKLAEETGSQLWIERVGTKDTGAIIIEDGEVVGASAEAAAE